MIGQFWVLLCPMPVHRGLYSFKERKIARCGWLRGCGESFLIINGRDGFRFFRALLFQKRLLFHFVDQVLIHRAAFDVIISLDNRCHIKELLSLVELANKVVDQCQNNHNQNCGKCMLYHEQGQNSSQDFLKFY
ncbi:hypothetical protein T02_1666 [Trichinella nativa]|uniref:Uncharacterized protein n=1 Tax=Trichinella nativa TaxID=6335 RepID=A0A0V1KS06_9BILA|nr:hypothetical protein T02_1666 [Trichinella nativa]